ncbi:nucleotidyltransferase [Halanaerocella petrolearia]
MNVLGIITEYNPFHLGHQIHLQKSLDKSNADATICIMSGCFLQRGRPAIIDQWARANMAIQSGVDLILQLPVAYSTRSAEYFALGAVQSLVATNIVDSICFGSEEGDIKLLKKLGQILANEPTKLSKLIQQKVKEGLSYPQARAKALNKYLESTKTNIPAAKAHKVLTNPNNILGLEYIKALTNLNSSITPLTIQRQGSGYHSKELNKIASASAIREDIKTNLKDNKELITEEVASSLPEVTVKILKDRFSTRLGPTFPYHFSQQILTLLRRINKTELKKYEGVTGGLENRIKEAAQKAISLSELISLIKTKRFTQTRIQRIMVHLLLGLTEDNLTTFDKEDGPQYLRVLGFNNQGRRLLKLIKEKGTLPLITKVANYFKTKQTPRDLLQEMLQYDLLANDLYNLTYNNQQAHQGGIDYRQQPILDL